MEMQAVDEYHQAAELFELGNYSSAQEILLKIIEINQLDFDALHLLGLVNLNTGKLNESVKCFEKVLSIYEPHKFAHYNLGLCLQSLGYFDESSKHYERAIELYPHYLDAINNLGVVKLNLNQFDAAEIQFNLAISLQPNNSKAYNNRGNLYFKLKKYDAAEKDYVTALSIDADNPEYHFNLGSCLLQKNKYEEAIELFNQVIQLIPGYTAANKNIALALYKLHRYKEAEVYFKKALESDRSDAQTYFNLASCYREMGDSDAAVKNFNEVIKLDPNYESVFVNIGNMYKTLGNDKLAEKYYGKVSGDKNSKAIAYTNLGVMRMGLGFAEDAIDYFNIALKYSQEYPEIHYNKSHALLISGNFEEGWKEYEWRKKRKEYYPREYSKPELRRGISVKGKRILVFDEQGLGDSIQFIRFIPKLKEVGADVILECNKLLMRIFKPIAGNSIMIERRIDKEPSIEYEYQIPLLSLPNYFNTKLETIPSEAPYIFPEKELASKMSKLINSEGNFKVGIVWGGNPKHTGDNKRSIPLSNFGKLLEVDNVKLFSLQKGIPLEQIKENKIPIVVLNDNLNDFADTAAVIENLDLVITIDTSVAHLAGAMKKPVWLLLPFFPDWRWLLERNNSPWYPSMRIFRQRTEGDWDYVFDNVIKELYSFINNKNPIQQQNYSADLGIKEIKSNLNENRIHNNKLYLGLTNTGDFGWGIVNKYLKKELSNRIEVYSLEEKGQPSENELNSAKVFQLLKDLDLNPLFNLRGKENFGYTVFENELNSNSVINAEMFDKVFAASSWGRNKLIQAGIKNSDCIIQGIDTNLFYPVDRQRNDNLFVIFSGGKFELRKGQDLVIKAISILQKKYKDIILINAWYNLWMESARLLTLSKYIKYEEKGNNWHDFMDNIYLINDVDPQRVFTMPLIPNQKLRDLYLKSDIGLFPNRCEGGTNLVMMEYMACGKPVIASYNTGHKDVLTENNSLLLKEMKKFNIVDQNQKLISEWEEPNFDEIIDKLEYAYNHRNEIKQIGEKAGESMKKFTWAHTADSLLKKVGI